LNKPKVFIAKKIPKNAEEYISKYCEYEIWDRDSAIPRDTLFKKLQDKEGHQTAPK
jgi:hypothetical protein